MKKMDYVILYRVNMSCKKLSCLISKSSKQYLIRFLTYDPITTQLVNEFLTNDLITTQLVNKLT